MAPVGSLRNAEVGGSPPVVQRSKKLCIKIKPELSSYYMCVYFCTLLFFLKFYIINICPCYFIVFIIITFHAFIIVERVVLP